MELNHFDKNGNAVMVDVSDKPVTHRTATATGSIQVSPEIMAAVKSGNVKKGDVLGVARVAGIMGVKRTSELIPMCHPLPIQKCSVDFETDEDAGVIRVFCTVKTEGKTGVEMEALTGVQVTLLKSFILQVPKNVSAKMDKLRVADAITEVFSLFKRCNKYIDETMPWALAKDETKQDRLATVLYNLVEGICIGASLLKSFMPRTTERILVQLNANERTLEEMEQFGLYPSGNRVTDKPEILFARLDLKEVLEKVEKLHPKKEEPKEEPKEEVEEEKTENVIDIEAKPEITFDDFEKLQFQVGEIIACEEVKNPENFSALRLRSEARFVRSYPESRLIIPQRKWWAKRLWSLQT